MKLEYGIIIFVGLLIFTILGLILSSPDDVPIHTEISKINQQGIVAQEANNEEKLEEYGSLMQKKMTSIARDSLRLNIFMSEVFQGYFPLIEGSKVEIPKGKEERTANLETFHYIQSRICHSSETNLMKKLDSTY